MTWDFEEDTLLKDYSRRLARSLSLRVPGPRTTFVMRRVKDRLKALVLFRLLYKEIVQYGTSSGFLDISGNYKPGLHSLVRSRQLDSTCAPAESRPWCSPLLPGSLFKRFWNAAMLVLLVITIVYVPVELSFLSETTDFSADVAMATIDYVFLTDVLVTLNTGFERDGKVVLKRKEIFLNYLKGTMVIDVISSFPFDQFSFSIKSKALLRYFRVFRLMKVFRAVRFRSIIKYLTKANALSQQRVAVALSRILGALILLMLLTHLTACLWYLAATSTDFKDGNWIQAGNFADESLSHLYLTSLYWSLTVLATIGYGDITAHSTDEKLVAITWMLVGAMFFSFFLSTMSSVITGLDLKGGLIRDKLELLKVYCNDLKLSKSFQHEMSRQLHKTMKHNTLDQGQKLDFVMMLSRPLRIQVGKSIFHSAYHRVAFFSQLDPAFIGNIVNLLEYRWYNAHETIYARWSYADEVYFMGTGRVSFMIGSQRIPFRTMISGSFFGEAEVLEEKPREYTAVADTHTEVFVLNRKVPRMQILALVVDEFPEVADKLAFIAKKRKELCLRSVIKTSNIISYIESKHLRGNVTYDKAITSQQLHTELTKLEGYLKLRSTQARTVREELFQLAVEMETLRRSVKVTPI